MPLSKSLLIQNMTFLCPVCGHSLTKRGSWFKSASRFVCEGCGTEVHISYDDKLRLFAEHERKARKAKQAGG